MKTSVALLALELGIIIGVGFAVALLHRLFQRRFRYETLHRHNDVAGWLFSAVGVIYAVLLGFIVVIVWQKFDAAVANTESEVAAVADLYRSVQGFPDPIKSRIRLELNDYMTAMQRYEWPAMERGTQSNESRDALETLAYDVNAFNPKNAEQQDAHQAAIAQEQRLFDARRVRMHEVEGSVPPVLWFALGIGAAVLIGLAFLFGVENGGFQLVMTAALAAVLALLFIVIAEFDRPFSGAVGVDMDGWTTLQERLSHVR